MLEIRAGLSFFFALIFVMLSIGNWGTVLRYVVTKKHSSRIPFLGGIAGAIAILIVPPLPFLPIASSLKPYFWVPLLLDFGCVPDLTLLCCFLLLRRFRNSSSKVEKDHKE